MKPHRKIKTFYVPVPANRPGRFTAFGRLFLTNNPRS